MIGCLIQADKTGVEIRFTWSEVRAIQDALSYSGTMQLSPRNTEHAWYLDQLIRRYRGEG